MIRVTGLFILLLAAGCAGTDRASQGEPPKTDAIQEKTLALEPQQAAAKPEEVVAAEPAPTAPKQDGPISVAPAPPPAAPPAAGSPNQSAAKPEAPAAKRPGQAPASPAPKKESAAPPPLDLESLETRLKETNAIGVFTKLTLKNQVDTLLDRFKAHYGGKTQTTLAQLRPPYDQLLLKVLALLQDSDPPLARAIAQSREAIWSILSDPDKFSKHL